MLDVDQKADWVLVPREPTPEMMKAGIDNCATSIRQDRAGQRQFTTPFEDECADIYRAMLAASPSSSPVSGGVTNRWGEPGVDLEIDRYERVHNLAIAEYERHVPASYRYSATGLRHAVDAAIRSALGEQP